MIKKFRVWYLLHALILLVAVQWYLSGSSIYEVGIFIGVPWLFVHGMQICHDDVEFPALSGIQIIASTLFLGAVIWGWTLWYYPPESDVFTFYFFLAFSTMALLAALFTTFFYKLSKWHLYAYPSQCYDGDSDSDSGHCLNAIPCTSRVIGNCTQLW